MSWVRAKASSTILLVGVSKTLAQSPALTTQASQAAPNAFRIIHHDPPPAVLTYRQSLKDVRPEMRGFRAPLFERADVPWPIAWPSDKSDQLQQAAEVVAKSLAGEGLLPTLAKVIQGIGPREFVSGSNESLSVLRSVGMPADLVEYFRSPTQPATDSTVVAIAKAIAAGIAGEDLRLWLNTFTFQFRPTRPGFGVVSETGDDELGMLRLQLTRGTYWQGVGDGGNIDLTRQLVEQLPDTSFVMSIERNHLDDFLTTARSWNIVNPQRITLITEPLIVAQWAQDNGKPGTVNDAASGARKVVTIVPRYASRGEDGSTFVSGETFLLDGLTGAGMDVFQSPLLFQGGDLMAVRDPASGQRILLIGEADIYRNTALGLSNAQVIEAFRIEFGVDRCEVLPAVSFHIDFELNVRAKDGRLIAFVNDSPAAVRIILACGVFALESHKIIDAATAKAARDNLESWNGGAFLESIFNIVMSHRQASGFPVSFAGAFSTSPVDSGVGNLQRFLLAMDMLYAWSLPPGQEPPDAHAAAYMRSFVHRDEQRTAFHKQLQALGFEVVLVPSLGDADRAINYLNGIHDRTCYLMPAYGGLFAPLDEAAKQVFEQTFGAQVKVMPMYCSETRRRVGGLHCSASAYPR